MTVWVVVSILALVLSPLAWLRPSRGQSGKMACRLRARQLGLAMQLAPQQWPHWLNSEAPSPCAQYHRARLEQQKAGWSYWQSAPGEWVNQWREACPDPAIAAILAHLPLDAYKVEADKGMVALYWGERGGPDTVVHIKDALAKLASH